MASTLSPIRQPFGAIDGARLRNLGNLKNVQNALSPNSNGKTLKRRHDPTPELDTENIDPNLFSPSKKAKGNSFDTPQKPHFILQTNSAKPMTTREILTPKKLSRKPTDTKPISFSAPAPAGRSPKSKRVGILSKRRTTGYGRVEPPSFNLKSQNAAPFSIDAALSGTVSSYKTPSSSSSVPLSLDEAMPTGWMFDIHEDTADEELGNLVQHSTQTLDISDDESKARELDARGKENIPPDTLAPHMIPLSRRDAMTDEPRTPLGDLDASEFYAEGCDANSYVIVDAEAKAEKVGAVGVEEKKETPTPSPVEVGNNQDVWRELLAKVGQEQVGLEMQSGEQVQGPGIEIWESESAKGDESPVEKEDVLAMSSSLEECYAVAEGREEAALAGSC